MEHKGDAKDDVVTVDMRSDTVTKPTKEMVSSALARSGAAARFLAEVGALFSQREAMLNAEVGDDVFGDDPSVLKLQAEACKIFNFVSCCRKSPFLKSCRSCLLTPAISGGRAVRVERHTGQPDQCAHSLQRARCAARVQE
jgi:hypothetical protein